MAGSRKKAAARPRKPKAAGYGGQKAEKRPIRREVGSIVCFLLAIFSLLGLMGVKALFIDFLDYLAKMLLGWGAYLLPPALLAASVVLLFHRGRPVRLRLVAVLLLPVTLGAILHMFKCKTELAWGFNIFGKLLNDGGSVTSGGLLCGLLGKALSDALSVAGATILLIVVLLAEIFVLFRLSIVKLYDDFRARPKYVPEPDPIRPKTPAASPASSPKKRSAVDIPLYLDETAREEPGRVGELKDKPEGVKTPAEALAEKPEPITIPQVFYFEDEPAKLDPETGEDVAPLAHQEEPEPEPVVPAGPPPDPAPPEPYRYPPISLLAQPRAGQAVDATEELRMSAIRLIEVLASFGIIAKISDITRGPTITRFEIELESGTKLARLTSLSDDIALALGTPGVNISPVQGKMSVVGVEVPNKLVSTVFIRDVLDSADFKGKPSQTAFAVGRDISGNNIVGDITKLTHLLIAGTTGSGKSVCMNSLIVSLLYKATPEEVKFIMVDPKMVELGVYNGIPHLLQPVVTDPKKAAGALEWAVYQMDKRFNLLLERGKRDIDSYNESVRDDPDTPQMERIIIIIDEMADLMMVARKEVETSIARIAQKARACGIHLILATQRPSAQVVTGIIKANTPSRIAFAVASNIDSRIILDTSGAEKLIGRGDMLYFPTGAAKPTRVQGCLISSDEVEKVVEYVKQRGQAVYSDELREFIEKDPDSKGAGPMTPAEGAQDEDDSMLPAAIEVIIEAGQGSVSFLQRRLKLGYARAARLMDLMEERGIVGPYEGSKPRKVLITKAQWDEMNSKG